MIAVLAACYLTGPAAMLDGALNRMAKSPPVEVNAVSRHVVTGSMRSFPSNEVHVLVKYVNPLNYEAEILRAPSFETPHQKRGIWRTVCKAGEVVAYDFEGHVVPNGTYSVSCPTQAQDVMRLFERFTPGLWFFAQTTTTFGTRKVWRGRKVIEVVSVLSSGSKWRTSTFLDKESLDFLGRESTWRTTIPTLGKHRPESPRETRTTTTSMELLSVRKYSPGL